MAQRHGPGGNPAALLSWLLGASIVVAVVAIPLHMSEWREFAALADTAQPWWLVWAFLLQLATYAAQAAVFDAAPRRAGLTLRRGWLFRLSLTKLFVDQALPSGGVSSTVVIAEALRQAGVPPRVVAASALVNIASYHAAYLAALAAALLILARLGLASAAVVFTAAVFGAFAVFMVAIVLLVGGRPFVAPRAALRLPVVRQLAALISDADCALLRNPRVFLQATAWQLVIALLDAATMWALLRALGASAPPAAVFASFMISSLVRTVGIVPGGLGTYEAASVITLRIIGLSLPVALSSTLLFRGLSFWLPMLPGLWFSRAVLAGRPEKGGGEAPAAYWSMPADRVAAALRSSDRGLSAADARARLLAAGPNELRASSSPTELRIFLAQMSSPLLLILIVAAAASIFTRAWIDAAIVLAIVAATVAIGYSKESGARAALAALQARVHVSARVVRDGAVLTIASAEVVPGDIVLLAAGSLVPADAVILDAGDFFVNEGVLTGESYPVEKAAGVTGAASALRERRNCVFLGTDVRSGTARCLAVRTGRDTEFGRIASRLSPRAPDTAFDRGVRQFGYLLTVAMFVFVLVVFTVHMLNARPVTETLLFTIALAVGLSPELLPAIITVNLARGAQMMAAHGVIVRRLNAIENLGSIDILCTDKTGTITEGTVTLQGAYDPSRAPSAAVLAAAARNAALETGVITPLDAAILAAAPTEPAPAEKRGEVPFDFVRKRVGIVLDDAGGARLIVKGAFDSVLDVCATVEGAGPLDAARRRELRTYYDEWTRCGIRVLGVATRHLPAKSTYTRDDERELAFAGFLTFDDRPKADAAAAIASLAARGISLRIITGDSRLVAQYVASRVGMDAERVISGGDMREMADDALQRAAESTAVFAEVDPVQKERIIRALKRGGHVVGFLGDGVNDALAMQAADTSLAVDQAVDVARAAADFVLLERSLDVIRRGVEEGRRTFANTLKYLLTTTSANLGNMLSVAAASLVLPFLPMLAHQILLNNLLSDVPAVGLAADNVDDELVSRPQRWEVGSIGRFMTAFGVLSSVFDLLTFAVLLFVFAAAPVLFRTAWFVESLLTELVVVIVLRTRRPFWRSRPGRALEALTAAIVAVAFAIPFLPFAATIGFAPLPGATIAAISAIAVAYVGATEVLKRWFFRNARRPAAVPACRRS